MKILFVVLHPGYLRHYENVISKLAEDNHTVHLAFNKAKSLDTPEGVIPKRLADTYPSVTYGVAPNRGDKWARFARSVRGTIDFLRYQDPRYDAADELRRRAGYKSRSPALTVLGHLPTFGNAILSRLLIRALKWVEAAIPPSTRIDRFMKKSGAEAVVVTPLIDFASSQEDYVKSARHLKIPCALCVASWDNLSNKGLIRQPLDSVIVWNEAQKQEAIEMHGVAADRVIITGAQSYDKWFARQSQETREAFCSRVGLRADRPYVLYLCSSPFIGGTVETSFVEDWVAALRASSDPRVADLGVLVRPHPQNAAIWQDFDETKFSNVAIYPREGANPILASSEADYYESMHHGSMVVGINTSGMIESGIVGRPVFTILDPRFNSTQTGTIHFHYLVEKGLLRIAASLPEHAAQLSGHLSDSGAWEEGNRQFLLSFVRPWGLEQAAAPRVADAIVGLRR
jgi:hypothetical protein